MDDHNCALLARNLQLNGGTNVTVQHAAVTDAPGVVTYVRRPGGPAIQFSGFSLDSRAQSSGDEIVEVPATTLDMYFGAQPRRPDVVKIDVEGAEYRVLRGMLGLLARSSPLVVVEVHPRRLTALGASARDLVVLLLDHGYQVLELEHARQAGPFRLRPLDLRSVPARNAHLVAQRTGGWAPTAATARPAVRRT